MITYGCDTHIVVEVELCDLTCEAKGKLQSIMIDNHIHNDVEEYYNDGPVATVVLPVNI